MLQHGQEVGFVQPLNTQVVLNQEFAEVIHSYLSIVTVFYKLQLRCEVADDHHLGENNNSVPELGPRPILSDKGVSKDHYGVEKVEESSVSKSADKHE